MARTKQVQNTALLVQMNFNIKLTLLSLEWVRSLAKTWV